MPYLARAMAEWKRAIGTSHVLSDPDSIRKFSSCTFPTRQRIRAVLRPRTTREVQACVRTAAKFKVPLYPVSLGKNWGYGSMVPPSDHCVLLYLGRLNRIVEYNEEMGYITVEPGVSAEMASEYLLKRKSPFMVNISANPEGSLIGNIMEDGAGYGKNGDDQLPRVHAIELVLPNGELLYTGMSRFESSRSANLYNRGVGPRVEGIFIQSGLGIATRMTLALYPKPKHFEVISFGTDQPKKLEAVVDKFRQMRLSDALRSRTVIFSDLLHIMINQQFPWESANGKRRLSPSLRKKLRQIHGVNLWNGQVPIAAPSKEIGEAECSLVAREISKCVGDLFFLSQDTIRRLRQSKRSPFSPGQIAQMADSLRRNPCVGYPSKNTLFEAYWRKKMPIPAKIDPDGDRCGLFWFVPIIPMTGRDVRLYTDLLEEAMDRFQLEIGVGLQLSTVGPTLKAVTRCPFDRDYPGEDERAMACYEFLFKKSIRLGYIPYRLGVNSMGSLPPIRGSYNELLRSIKQAVDPHGIISPGRYIR